MIIMLIENIIQLQLDFPLKPISVVGMYFLGDSVELQHRKPFPHTQARTALNEIYSEENLRP